MSGQRWSISLILIVVYLTGCKSSESGRFGWNFLSERESTKNASGTQQPAALSEFDGTDSDRDRILRGDSSFPVAEEHIESLLSEGQLALQDDRIDDAVKAYSKVLDASPEHATAHHGMAMAADLSQRWSDAEYHYRQALRVRPRDANLLCDIGYSYLLQNRYTEASRYLNHALEVRPEHESALLNLALLDLRQGNRKAAETRIVSRFGNSAQGAQILAELDRQTSAVAVGFRTVEGDGVVPANASFEQVQEIARRERIESERRRAMQRIPQGPMFDNAVEQPVSVLSNQGAPQAGLVPGPSSVPEVQSRTMWNEVPLAANPEVRRATEQPALPMGQNAAALYSRFAEDSRHVGDFARPQPYLTASQAQANNTPGNHREDPGGAHSSEQLNDASTPYIPGPQSAATVSVAVTESGSHSVNGPSPGPNEQSSGLRGNVSSASGKPSLGTHGRIVQVHSSGIFETRGSGSLSYGQPLGFGSGGYQSAPTPNASGQAIRDPSVPTHMRALPASGNFRGFDGRGIPSTLAEAQTIPDSGVRSPVPYFSGQSTQVPMYVDGLNAGPGAIFPISSANSGVVGRQDDVPMNSHSSPRSTNTSTVPGLAPAGGSSHHFGSDVSLAEQAWMYQQQVAQQLNLPTMSAELPVQQRPATSSSSVASPQPPPPALPPAPNPLESYERQRRQLDSDYSRTLQQMSRGNANSVPSFP